LERALGARVYAARRAPHGRPRPLRQERAAWRAAVREATTRPGLLIAADVQACFPSVTDASITAASFMFGGSVGPLLRVIRELADRGVEGLPIGPRTSADVANGILAVADSAVRREGIEPIRWVDDLLFIGPEPRVLRAYRAWQETLVDLGLHENEAKFRIQRVGRASDLGLGHPSHPQRPARGIIRSP
jgi:hypothetical protein